MNGLDGPAGPAPLTFALTEQDARTAAARAGLRAALAGRLSRHHAAPLVAFTLLVTFVAILAFAGLLGRRRAEAALIVAAMAFMAVRMAAHWRLRSARNRNFAALDALRRAGMARIRLDDSSLHLETSAGARRLRFADCDEAEDAGAILYLWPRAGAPAVIPVSAFADERAARDFLALLRAAIGRAASGS
ncbi:MAG: hypothetical protein ABSG83_02505 [Roseiarcus sp.]|jgi:hypothetical protein